MDILPFPDDTKVFITKIPDNGVVLKYLGVPVIEGQEFKITDLDHLEAVNESGFKGRLSNFKYKVDVPDVIEKPEKYVYLYFKPAPGTPTLVSVTEECLSEQELKFSDLVSYEDKYDNIIFDEIQGNQDEWTINDELVSLGMVYPAKFVFENLVFKPRTNLVTTEYSILSFSFLKDKEISLSGNVITIDTIEE